MMNKEAVQKIIDQLLVLSDDAYIRYCRKMETAACLGWEFKAANGLFSEAEFKAHCAANVLFGRHEGFYEALKILSEELAKIDNPRPTALSPLLDNEEDATRL